MKQYHTINRATFVCLFPISSEVLLTDLCQTWWVYVGGPRNCPWGVLFRKGQRVNGSTDHFHFHYIIYAPASRHTAAKGAFCFAATASKSLIWGKGTFCCTASRRMVGVCRWTSELPLRGSFSKRSTGQWIKQVDGSKGHFFGHYIIYDTYFFVVLICCSRHTMLTAWEDWCSSFSR